MYELKLTDEEYEVVKQAVIESAEKRPDNNTLFDMALQLKRFSFKRLPGDDNADD